MQEPEFTITEFQAVFDFDYAIDMDALESEFVGTPYEFHKKRRGCVVWRVGHAANGKSFSHQLCANGDFSMTYVNMDRGEALAVFRDLYPMYIKCQSECINQSRGFERRCPERLEALKRQQKAAKRAKIEEE